MANSMAEKAGMESEFDNVEGPEGEWTFQMYTDVLHAQCKGADVAVADQLAEASRNIQQEFQKKLRQVKSKDNAPSPPTLLAASAVAVSTADVVVGSPPEVSLKTSFRVSQPRTQRPRWHCHRHVLSWERLSRLSSRQKRTRPFGVALVMYVRPGSGCAPPNERRR